MDDGPDPLLDAARSARPPREHHYTYAHRLLPFFVHKHAADVRRLLTGPQAVGFLRELWDKLGSDLGPAKALPGVGLACSLAEDTPARTIALVWLPEPAAAPEAWYAAVVFGAAGVGPRYFTLEQSLGQRTALCEWRPDGTHANFGTGPAPDADAFARAVAELLGKDPAP